MNKMENESRALLPDICLQKPECRPEPKLEAPIDQSLFTAYTDGLDVSCSVRVRGEGQ